MTRTTNARIAGFTFLVYIAAGITSLVLFSQATGGQEVPAKLENIARHVFQLRLTTILGLLGAVCAFVLAVTLYAITRDQDSDLANARFDLPRWRGFAQLGTSTGPTKPDAVTLQALGTYILAGPEWIMAAVLFAMGSTLFSYLFLRAELSLFPWRGLTLLPRSFSWWSFLCNSLSF